MSSLTVGWIAFACIFGGSMVGMTLGVVLPEQHLSQEAASRRIVQHSSTARREMKR